MKIACVSY